MKLISSCYACVGTCTYLLFYRQVAEMVNERGMEASHTTISRYVQQYELELNKC